MSWDWAPEGPGVQHFLGGDRNKVIESMGFSYLVSILGTQISLTQDQCLEKLIHGAGFMVPASQKRNAFEKAMINQAPREIYFPEV